MEFVVNMDQLQKPRISVMVKMLMILNLNWNVIELVNIEKHYDAKIEEEQEIAAAAEAENDWTIIQADITDMVNSITESVETEPVQTTMSVEETLDNFRN